MRDTKFRGKSLKNGEWLYGNLLRSNGSRAVIVSRDILDDDFDILTDLSKELHNFEVDFETVSQYTEQNDIKGDEIYEGMSVHQVSVLAGSPDIDFVGYAKFYDGSWCIDSGLDSISLFNENCQNEIVEDSYGFITEDEAIFENQ